MDSNSTYLLTSKFFHLSEMNNNFISSMNKYAVSTDPMFTNF